jgi:hypothetical protein
MQLANQISLVDIKSDLYFNGKFNSSTYVQNDLNRIINKVYKMVQEDIRAVNEDFFLVNTTALLDLDVNTNGQYTYPSDYEKIKSIWVALTPANKAAPLFSEYSKVDIINANAQTNPSYTFSTPTAVTFGTFFKILPALTDATLYPVTKGIKTYYIPTQADLVNDTDVPLIFSDYHDVITWGSLIEIANRNGDNDLYKKATDKFKERRAELKRDASQRVLDISPEYVEGNLNQGGWSFPWGSKGL